MLESPVTRAAVLFACAALFVVCDSLAAYWGRNASHRALWLLIPLAPFSYVLFGYLNQRYPLAVVSGWVTIFLCISTVLIGHFVFHDQLTARQMLGLILALPAMVLLVL